MINHSKKEPTIQKEEDALAHIANCANKHCQNLYEGWRAFVKWCLEYKIHRLKLQLAEAKKNRETSFSKLDAAIEKLKTELAAALALHKKYWPDSPIAE
ncbi:MAG: hypothetical protein FJ044_04955 [Candidatus Cloacimonetes bacterium]|nr:hypothetical protein [Candidatus Cloacimonadota bacterium]